MQKHKRPRKLLFFVNPISGGINKSNLPGELENFCKRNGIDFRICETRKGKDNSLELEAIKNFGPDAVVAAGGDGTVHFVGKMVLNTGLPLGIIPLGSANALAKNLYIPMDTNEALKTIYRFKTREIDSLYVNDHHCLHICDIGFNASVIVRFDKSKYRGMGSYALCMLKELMSFKYFSYKVSASNQNLEGKAFSITVTNTRIYGTQAVINPQGKMNDGKFEICVIKPFPKLMIFPLTFHLFRKTLHLSPYSIYMRTENAELYNFDHKNVQIDGEPEELTEKISFRINPHSLTVIS